jgi:hypothetical protein
MKLLLVLLLLFLALMEFARSEVRRRQGSIWTRNRTRPPPADPPVLSPKASFSPQREEGDYATNHNDPFENDDRSSRNRTWRAAVVGSAMPKRETHRARSVPT